MPDVVPRVVGLPSASARSELILASAAGGSAVAIVIDHSVVVLHFNLNFA